MIVKMKRIVRRVMTMTMIIVDGRFTCGAKPHALG